VHTVHRLQRALLREEAFAADIEVHMQVAHGQQRLDVLRGFVQDNAHGNTDSASRTISATGRWQARSTIRSFDAGSSGGRCELQMSITNGQRSENGQPAGRRAMLGGTPGIATSFS